MANRQNEWTNRRWQSLIEERGGKCLHCEKTHDLEFAHTESTGLCGKSRGKYRRLRDVLKHPTHYILLCMVCHDLFDGRKPRFRQSNYEDV